MNTWICVRWFCLFVGLKKKAKKWRPKGSHEKSMIFKNTQYIRLYVIGICGNLKSTSESHYMSFKDQLQEYQITAHTIGVSRTKRSGGTGTINRSKDFNLVKPIFFSPGVPKNSHRGSCHSSGFINVCLPCIAYKCHRPDGLVFTSTLEMLFGAPLAHAVGRPLDARLSWLWSPFDTWVWGLLNFLTYYLWFI